MTVRPTREETHTESTPEASEPSISSELLTLQGQLADAHLQLDKAREQNRQLDAELKETEEALQVTKKDLAAARGDSNLLEREVQILTGMLDNLQSQKAISDQQVKSLEQLIAILQQAISVSEADIAASKAQEKQATWTKVAAIIAAMSMVLTAVFSIETINIKDFFERLKKRRNAAVAKTAIKNIRAIHIQPFVQRGCRIPLEVEVAPGITCQPTITYSSGRQRQLEAKHVANNGKISWEFLIDSGVKPGKWKVSIKCFPSGEYQDVEFRVI